MSYRRNGNTPSMLSLPSKP